MSPPSHVSPAGICILNPDAPAHLEIQTLRTLIIDPDALQGWHHFVFLSTQTQFHFNPSISGRVPRLWIGRRNLHRRLENPR